MRRRRDLSTKERINGQSKRIMMRHIVFFVFNTFRFYIKHSVILNFGGRHAGDGHVLSQVLLHDLGLRAGSGRGGCAAVVG